MGITSFIKNLSLPMLLILSAIVGLLIGGLLAKILKAKKGNGGTAYHCEQCHSPIKSWDNIPVLSYIFFPGRCKVCSWPIRPRSILTEIFSAIIVMIIVLIIRFAL